MARKCINCGERAAVSGSLVCSLCVYYSARRLSWAPLGQRPGSATKDRLARAFQAQVDGWKDGGKNG